MQWKSFFKKLFFPPLWLSLILCIFSAAALSLIFIEGLSKSYFAYASYVISFYALCLLCAYFYCVMPKQYKTIKSKVYAHPIGKRYMTDAAYKTHIKLYASLAANLLYVFSNLLSWFYFRSMWFIVLAVYYVILAVMRFLLLRYVRFNKIGANRLGELQRARLCSCIMLLVNFVLTGAVMMILYENRGFEYRGILIYAMAAYTFYITTHAIIDLVKYRKYKSPVMTTAKIISLSAALVSMLALETAMFSQFGAEMSKENQWIMVALTGAGVSITVISLSLFMIFRTAKEIKEIKINGNQK